MKITTLIENKKLKDNDKLKAQHGVSLLIESNGHKILFDTGASQLFSSNAKQMDLALSDVDFAIISHSHHDHCGGLRYFFDENNTAKVYIKRSAFESYYVKIFGFFKKSIGIDKSLLENYKDRFVLIDNFTEISKNIYIISNIIDTHPKPLGNKNLFKKSGGVFINDNFEHELVFVVREEDGLVVFTGCSHNGILNMIETVENHFQGEQIKGVVGGFHFMNPITQSMAQKREEVIRLGRILYDKNSLEKVFSGHCTGKTAYSLLESEMKEKIESFSTGSVIMI